MSWLLLWMSWTWELTKLGNKPSLLSYLFTLKYLLGWFGCVKGSYTQNWPVTRGSIKDTIGLDFMKGPIKDGLWAFLLQLGWNGSSLNMSMGQAIRCQQNNTLSHQNQPIKHSTDSHSSVGWTTPDYPLTRFPCEHRRSQLHFYHYLCRILYTPPLNISLSHPITSHELLTNNSSSDTYE